MVAAHQRDQEAEHRGLHQTREDVLELQEVHRVAQIGRVVEVELVDADQEAAQHADDVGDQHQERQGEDARDQPGHDQILERVGRERGERIDLFGDAHGADFGSHRGADPTGDHQACQHGTQLAGQRDHDDVGDRAFGGEAREAGIALQRQHHAGEDRGSRPTTGSE